VSTGRLIIVCGLPGSGKTTLAKAIEERLDAVRFSPDDWVDALGVDLHEEESRARIEALQWSLAQRLLTLDLAIIVEWGTWENRREMAGANRGRVALFDSPLEAKPHSGSK
jgi:broad-specificity NMP kinase